MNSLKAIENDVIKITTLIAGEYPELYVFLEENPVTIPTIKHPYINIKIMRNYLESLKQLLKHHIKTRKTK